ncbi:autotransporter serine protease [Pseudoxanthomonas sp.]|uniref:autotransporter serine protease n=1 Tax=Pseudoxanthomonas sp. TaxID=1871049 RepID=UPI0026327752|nr:autotransporter serine protease [Pseudoxanthomonas sp.]WDS36672.1 MAG: S8 family serine peptidase [Pseudoxanthomonas sp.]
MGVRNSPGTWRAGHRVLGTLACAVLSACGGGGGGSNVRETPPATTPVPPVVTPVVTTANPAYSRHLTLTHADVAHAAGFTGAGTVIGIVDTGVNRTHPALSPRVTANLNYVSASDNNLAKDDVVGHGTAVAQVAAGAAFGAWPGGIAPDATVVSARIISDQEPTDDGTGQGNATSGALGLASVHAALIARGVKVMNNSWGGVYWTDLAATAPIAEEYRPFVIDNGGLVVFATGNDGKSDPSDTAALPSKAGTNGSMPAADLERGWLAVAALDTDNSTQLASYSNACGVAMHYCLVAPGTVVVTGTDDGPAAPTYYQWTGTSLAAPQVSGAAAVVWQAFPYFSNDLVRQTLLGTATDLGTPGVDATFGYGLLDVGKAIGGPAKFDWGDVSVSFAGNSTWSNAISGSGGIAKLGSGTLTLTGTNSYLGTTHVAAGALVASQALPASAVVDAGARLTLSGGINGSLSNAGTTRFDGNAGVRTVAGNFSQAASGALEYQVGTPLAVGGIAQLAGGLQVFGVAGGYVRSSQETVLTAAQGLTGQFSSLTSGSGVFLDASLSYTSSQALLNITRLEVTATAAAMGITTAAVGSAQRVDQALDRIDAQGAATVGGDFVTLAGDFLHTASAAAAQRSLASLSGSAHAAADSMTLDVLDMRRRALSQHLLQPGAPRGGAWYQALDDRQARGLGVSAFDVGGWLLGNEVMLAPGTTAGIAFGQLDASNSRNADGDRSHDRQTHLQVYLGQRWGRFYAIAQLGAGDYRRQLQRQVYLGAGAYGVGSDDDGTVRFASVEAGLPLAWRRTRLTPYVGADYAALSRDGFSEVGAGGFGLAAAGDQARRTQAIAGLRLDRAMAWAGMELALSGHAEWQSVLSAAGFERQARFVGIDAWGLMPAGDAAASGGLFGVSFDAQLRAGQRLSLGFDRRFGPRGTLGIVSASYRVGF